MERKGAPPRYEEMLRCFTHLPQTILSLHGIDNMTEFVLHTLCNEGCLNLTKAAYFIDNPDFDCLKGVAGFDKTESHHCKMSLNDQNSFSDHLQTCDFNKKVRSVSKPSFKRQDHMHDQLVKDLAEELSIDNSVAYTWDIKHDNSGLLLFERDFDQELSQEFLKGLSLLGFCPVC